MSWTVERRGRVAVVTMATNPVNAQNRAFFADLRHSTSWKPSTPTAPSYSPATVAASPPASTWTSTSASPPAHPNPSPPGSPTTAPPTSGSSPTPADRRRRQRPRLRRRPDHLRRLRPPHRHRHRRPVRPQRGPDRHPMPAVYVRILAYAWGEKTAARTCLFGETFGPHQAMQLGIFDELVTADELLDRAVAVAESVPGDCLEQYAFTKTRHSSRRAARHRRPRRPPRHRTPHLDDQRQLPARPPPLLDPAQERRAEMVMPAHRYTVLAEHIAARHGVHRAPAEYRQGSCGGHEVQVWRLLRQRSGHWRVPRGSPPPHRCAASAARTVIYGLYQGVCGAASGSRTRDLRITRSPSARRQRSPDPAGVRSRSNGWLWARQRQSGDI